jgi:sterol desaturase/sphingolipid hydroxylase (fatty acid hydroxylase superfamily)
MPLLKLILSPIVFFTLLGGLFHFLERRSGKHPRPLQLRKGFWTDIFYFLSAPALKAVMKLLLIAPAMVLVMMQVSTPGELKAGLYHGYGPLGSQPAWLQLLEIYILVDLCGYWMHRLFHTGRWWPFHAIHHSSEELDWLSSVRVHPLNELLNHVAQATPVLLLGFNPLLTL